MEFIIGGIILFIAYSLYNSNAQKKEVMDYALAVRPNLENFIPSYDEARLDFKLMTIKYRRNNTRGEAEGYISNTFSTHDIKIENEKVLFFLRAQFSVTGPPTKEEVDVVYNESIRRPVVAYLADKNNEFYSEDDEKKYKDCLKSQINGFEPNSDLSVAILQLHKKYIVKSSEVNPDIKNIGDKLLFELRGSNIQRESEKITEFYSYDYLIEKRVS